MIEASKKWWGTKADLTDAQKHNRAAVGLWLCVGLFGLLELWAVTRSSGGVRSSGVPTLSAAYLGGGIETLLSVISGERGPIFWMERGVRLVPYIVAVFLPVIAAMEPHGRDHSHSVVAIALSLAIFAGLMLRIVVLWRRRPRVCA